MAERVYESYADALLGVVLEEEKDALKDVRDSLRSITRLLFEEEEGEELLSVLSSEALPLSSKRPLLEKTLLPSIDSKALKAFLSMLLDRGGLYALPKIEASFRKKANEKLGILEGKLLSAKPLSPEEKENIQKSLSKRLGFEVLLKEEIDPELLGGAKAIVGETLYDGSLSGRLMRLRESLLKGDNR